jgi:hypothetical protein
MNLFKGERRNITLEYIDEYKKPIDMSSYTFSLVGKVSRDQQESVFTFDNTKFDKTNANTGTVILDLDAAKLDPDYYICQVLATSNATVVYSPIFNVEIMESLCS